MTESNILLGIENYLFHSLFGSTIHSNLKYGIFLSSKNLKQFGVFPLYYFYPLPPKLCLDITVWDDLEWSPFFLSRSYIIKSCINPSSKIFGSVSNGTDVHRDYLCRHYGYTYHVRELEIIR